MYIISKFKSETNENEIIELQNNSTKFEGSQWIDISLATLEENQHNSKSWWFSENLKILIEYFFSK